jgi:DNA polymerase-3 subunit epsilon
MFCVLDIEGTGGPFGKEAIMEIAVFRFNGQVVEDQLISLVHPHRSVQKFVSKITGITEKMLVRAPRFHEIAKRLIEITQDAVIVGHNVDFDYRMLRQEFARLGYQYERKTLDTIKLAQELFPGLKAYGLDAICEELGIYRNQKHRAESDARATLELLMLMQEKDRGKDISRVGESIKSTSYNKDKMYDLQRSVQQNKGVFYLHDAKGELLYIGASENIKTALNRMLMAEGKEAKEIRQLAHSVRVETCGNWLIARIKRHEELKAVNPPFNKNNTPTLALRILVDQTNQKPRFKIITTDQTNNSKELLKFADSNAGLRAIRMFKRLKNEEKKALILERLLHFPSEALYTGKGRKGTEHCVFVVQQGKLKGYQYYKLSDQIDKPEQLAKTMAPVKEEGLFTEMLKLGILSGEFKFLT